MEEEKKTQLSKSQMKKLNAQVYNATRELANDLFPIGKCGYCECKAGEEPGILFSYLKSNPENICNYYCMKCNHKGTIKEIDKKDSFLFPMVDIVGEISRHYDADVFDKAYNG